MIILGLGSNLGDREANLRAAITLVGELLLNDINESSIITTKALVPDGAPTSWDIDYLNMAISGELKNPITPQDFLTAIKDIETKLGRKPSERWAPRVIDIDILSWNNDVIDEPNLQIPHIGISSREFVKIPMLEIAPDWINPRTGLRLDGK